jgi:TolB-like protein/DNA-binding winged helix-turn-helix (wHTH) protein/Flp pilus assembly protein TadD
MTQAIKATLLKTMPTSARTFRFGVFSLRTATQQLYKGSIRVKLRPQAFHVLELLADNAGEVVSREQLRQKLWPEQPYVDFEHGLNTAVKELRGVLNDSAAEPRFIETLPRLGYRFIVPVTREEGSGKYPALVGDVEASANAVANPSSGATTPSPDVRASEPSAAFDSAGSASGAHNFAASSSAAENATAPASAANASAAAHRESGWQAQSVNAASSNETSAGAATATRKSNTATWFAIAVAAAIVVASIVIAVRRNVAARHAAAAPESRRMLAVLPFANLTGDASQDYFSDGLTEEMIGQLGQLDPPHLGVIGRNSVMRYKTAPSSNDQIARDLGVDYLLEGSVRRDAEKVRVTAELIQVGNPGTLWSRQYDSEMKDVLAVQSQISREIATEIHLTLGDAHSSFAVEAPARTPASNEAYDLYLRGLYFWNKRDTDSLIRAMNYFEQAVAKDPDFARAYAALADTQVLYGGYAGTPPKELLTKAHTNAARAVELDPNLAEAHASLAVVAQDGDWDWATAEKEYKRAIHLNPNYATAHHWYGEYLGLMGRFDEAFAELERARTLDPLSLIITADKGVTLYYARDYDGAIRQFRAVMDMEPDFPRTAPLPYSYLKKGMVAEARAFVEHRRERGDNGPWYWSSAAYVYGQSGEMDRAHADLASLEEMSAKQPVDPITLVPAYVGVGDTDHALGALERARLQHSISLTSVGVEPIYDSLRNDPRFTQLLREMHLTQ